MPGAIWRGRSLPALARSRLAVVPGAVARTSARIAAPSRAVVAVTNAVAGERGRDGGVRARCDVRDARADAARDGRDHRGADGQNAARVGARRPALGVTLMATRGYAAAEVEQAYARARELCRQMGETPRLFPVLWGLTRFYLVRTPLQTARELAEHILWSANAAQYAGVEIWRPSVLGLLAQACGASGQIEKA